MHNINLGPQCLFGASPARAVKRKTILQSGMENGPMRQLKGGNGGQRCKPAKCSKGLVGVGKGCSEGVRHSEACDLSRSGPAPPLCCRLHSVAMQLQARAMPPYKCELRARV